MTFLELCMIILIFAFVKEGIMITRNIEGNIVPLLGKGKAIIVMGARQVGKSTLLQQMLGDRKDVVWMNGDELDIQELFREMTSTRIRAILGNNRFWSLMRRNVFRTSGFG